MECRPCWYVQSVEDGAFLAPDGEGGVIALTMLSDSVPFDTREAAIYAVVDHLDGQGVIISSFVPVDC